VVRSSTIDNVDEEILQSKMYHEKMDKIKMQVNIFQEIDRQHNQFEKSRV
jgi:hypothetical protein